MRLIELEEVPIVRLAGDGVEKLPDRIKAVLCLKDLDGVYREVDYSDYCSAITALDKSKLKEDAEIAIGELLKCSAMHDTERSHFKADAILCDFIRKLGYPEVVKAFDAVDKWYA